MGFLQLAHVFNRLRKAGRTPKSRPFSKPTLEFLECRVTPSINIQLNFSYDSGFFTNHPDRQSLLATAANVLGNRIGDSLDAIIPNADAGNTWTAVFTDPSTGNTTQIDNLTIPANAIVIFAGGRSLGGAVGIGGPGGFNASGDQGWLDTVQ